MNRGLSRLPGALGRLLFGLYAWAVFLPVLLFAILAALVLPGLARRRRWVTRAARAFFWFTGTVPTVTGLERLPGGHCIVVANHASYVDGVIMQACLPPRFSFVIKGEVRKVPVLHLVLRRVGSKFVERFAAAGSARDARTLVKAASSGESMVFFPEGTFIATPGLGRFRSGAFAAAIKGRLPVVPTAIRGSRKMLPAKTLLPAWGPIRVDILEPIEPADAAFDMSASLAEAARQRILEVLDEPDLLLADSPAPDQKVMPDTNL